MLIYQETATAFSDLLQYDIEREWNLYLCCPACNTAPISLNVGLQKKPIDTVWDDLCTLEL